MNYRNNMTVHTVGVHEGEPCTLSSKTYESINQAKKANGINASTMKRGFKLPPTRAEIDAAIKAKQEAEAQAEEQAAA